MKMINSKQNALIRWSVSLICVLIFVAGLIACSSPSSSGSSGTPGPDAVALLVLPLSKSLKPGEDFTLSWTVVPEDAPIISWVSADTDVAVVDGNGKVTAKGLGKTNITATAKGGITSSCTVTITPDFKNATTSPAGKIASIAFGGGIFVAGGSENGKIFYSSDKGITWNVAADSKLNSDETVKSIAYGVYGGTGTFVAVGGRLYSPKIVTSTDGGITWTLRTIPPSSIGTCISSVAYGNNTFVIGAEDSKMAMSTDGGQNWTAITGPFTTRIYSIAFGNEKFVAGGGDGGKIAYSDNTGTTWTPGTISPVPSDVSESIDSIAHGNGKFLALEYLAKKLVSSENGTTWNQIAMVSDSSNPFPADSVKALCFGNGLFFVMSERRIGFSQDGQNIILLVVADLLDPMNCIAIGNDTVVVGLESGKVKYAALK